MSLISSLVTPLALPVAVPLGGIAETVASYTVSIAGLTDNATYGATAQIGGTLTASASGWSGEAPSAVTWQWYDGTGVIGGATGPSYTPVPGDDLSTIYARATPSDGEYGARSSNAYTVRRASPTALGGIADQSFVAGAAIALLEVASDFTGSGLGFALAPASAPLPAGLSLSGSGQITGTPSAEAAGVTIIVRGTNSGGFADTAFGIAVGAAVVTGAATIDSVSVGSVAGGGVPVTITASEATGSDVGYWVLDPSGSPAPSAAQVRNGQASGGGAPSDSGSFPWTGTPSMTLANGLTRQNYGLHVINDNGALSNVATSPAFLLSTRGPALTGPTASDNGASITWGATSDLAAGTIHAGLYPSANPTPSAAEIIAGSGDVIDTDTDASPAANATNAGTFNSVSDGTYRVAMVQVDDFGNNSNVVSTAGVTISAATDPATDIPALAGAGLQVLLDGTDFTRLCTDANGASDVTAAGNPVRHLKDLSAHRNNFKANAVFSAGNAIARNGYVQMNNAGIPVDGSTQSGDTSFQNGGYGFTTDMEVFALLALNGDTEMMLFGNNLHSNRYGAFMKSGDTGTAVNGDVSGVISINGSDQVSPSRDSLYTNFVSAAGGGFAVLSMRGVDLSAAYWKRSYFMLLGGRGGDTSRSDVFLKFFVVTTQRTAQQRADIISNLLGAA